MTKQSRFRPSARFGITFPAPGSKLVQSLSSKHFAGPVARSALLSARQVAQLLGVSTAIVYRESRTNGLEQVSDGRVVLEVRRARRSQLASEQSLGGGA